jgi:DNA segregation ATPase FtsK/SpoIIIE-like protein
MLGQPDLLVNFYELPEMRKYMDDLEDKQVDKTGMALSKPHVLVCGSTGSGKSQWLLNYILRTSNTFLKIIMIVAKPNHSIYIYRTNSRITFNLSLD